MRRTGAGGRNKNAAFAHTADSVLAFLQGPCVGQRDLNRAERMENEMKILVAGGFKLLEVCFIYTGKRCRDAVGSMSGIHSLPT